MIQKEVLKETAFDDVAFLTYSEALPGGWLVEEESLWTECFATVVEYGDDLGIKTVADLGCGPGKLAELMTEQFGLDPARVYAIDPSEILIAAAQRRSSLDGANFIAAKIEDLDLRGLQGQFDLVAANMVFHYFDDEAFSVAVRNCFLMLRPGGFLAFLIPHFWLKSERYRFPRGENYNLTRRVAEKAPWGGVSGYYHRSFQNITQMMKRVYEEADTRFRFWHHGLFESGSPQNEHERMLWLYKKDIV